MLNRDTVKIAIVVVAVVAAIWAGFDYEVSKIKTCSIEVTRKVMAEFSETTVSVCTDSDGAYYTCEDTDYWEEQASETYYATTINGQLESYHGPEPTLIGHGYYSLTSYPPVTERMDKDPDFDRYSNRHNVSFFIVTEHSSFGESANKYKQCLARLGKPAVIKTWYGIQYGIDEGE